MQPLSPVSGAARSPDALLLNILAASTFVALALAPIGQVFFDLRDHDAQRIVQIALLGVAAGVVSAGLVIERELPRTEQRGHWVAVALATLGALAVLHGSVRSASMLEAGLTLGLAIFAIGTASVVSKLNTARLLVVPVLTSLLLAFAVAVRYGAALSADASLLREHLIPGYSNYRFFNHVQTVTIPLLGAAVSTAPERHGFRRWAAAALVIEFCLLFFTGGRATVLALVLGTIVVAAVFRRDAIRWITRLGFATILGATLYLILFSLMPTLLGLPRDYFTADAVERSTASVGGPREYLWGLAWQYIKESPLLGIGPMHYAYRVNSEASHPHNIYLQLASEWGLPFAALITALALFGWLRLVQSVKRCDGDDERALGMSLVAACVAIAVDGVFSGNFVMPMSQLWIAFAIGLSIEYVRSKNQLPGLPIDGVKGGRGGRWLISGLCVVSQLAIWQGVWPEILDVNGHVDKVRAEIVHNVRDNPRIWSHGWIR